MVINTVLFLAAIFFRMSITSSARVLSSPHSKQLSDHQQEEGSCTST